jgi:DNA repair exonuclease SbcCD nuclease subunit
MKRTVNKKTKIPTAILSADWHLREDRPKCRIDNFGETLKQKIDFIKKLQQEHNNIPIIIAGDLFHRAKPRSNSLEDSESNYNLLTWCLRNLPDNMIVIPGQHDLPNHNLDLINQSNLSVLAEAGKIILRKGLTNEWLFDNINFNYFPFGKILTQERLREGAFRNIAVIHDFIYEPDKDYFPGIEKVGGQALNLLKKYDYDLILSGDNHRTFVVRYKGKILVNPGSLYRSTTKQINHYPSVFLWYAEDNTVEQVFIPIQNDVIDDDYIIIEKRKENKIKECAEKLKNYDELDIDFKKNIQGYLAVNRQHSKIKEIINECIEV